MIPFLTSAVGLSLVLGLASMFYVYRLRGVLRFAGVGEYFRKGWPIFSPLNCLLYAGTERRARGPLLDLALFPELSTLRENWETLRDEGMQLAQAGFFDAARHTGTSSAYDVGFRTFFKYGWSRFYLKWYGYYHDSAQELCPRTVEILRRVPAVNGAMFALLPPHSGLTRHMDPVACSLRYHLGLATPNTDSCFIAVDGNVHSWRDGQGLLFDETYMHLARNDTDTPRLILMCDVERPMNLVGRFVNIFYKLWMRVSIVPNAEGDRRGIANRIFSTVSPFLARLKVLKQHNRPLYGVVKWSINLLLTLTALGLLAGTLAGAWWLVS